MEKNERLKETPNTKVIFYLCGYRDWYLSYKLLYKITKYFLQVLQRKTEEAAMATKKLKELLEARKSSSRDTSGMIRLVGNNVKFFLAKETEDAYF